MRVAIADSRDHSSGKYSELGYSDQQTNSSFSELAKRMGRHFSRPEPRKRAVSYVAGLLSRAPRKNGHTLASLAEENASDGMQRLLTTAKWDVDAVRDELRSCVLEWFGDRRSLLVASQASFVKRGRHSAGVHQQYSETSGRLENCQIGLFLGYVSPVGTAFIDRELYLPDEWREDTRRCAKAGIPELAFASRADLARRMLRRALSEGVPTSWVVTSGMADIGVPLHRWLQQAAAPNVVEVRPTAPLRVRLGGRTVAMSGTELLRTVPTRQWQTLHCRASRWSRLTLASSTDSGTSCWLLTRHGPDGKLMASYAAYGPTSAPLPELAGAVNGGQAVNAALSRAKSRVGLDHYEARRYEAWYRHVTLALMADALAEAQTSRAQAGSGRLPHRVAQRPGAGATLAHGPNSRWPLYTQPCQATGQQ